jgi:hypothetical protein
MKGRNSNFIQKEPFQKNSIAISVTSSYRNFPSKAEREASTDRRSQFQDPSLRKNPHFYKRFFWQGKEQFLTLYINSQLIKYMGVFLFFLGLG